MRTPLSLGRDRKGPEGSNHLFPHFSWSWQSPGHQSPRLERLQAVRARLSGASLPSPAVSCCSGSRTESLGQEHTGKNSRHLGKTSGTKAPGLFRGCAPPGGRAMWRVGGPYQAIAAATFPPHRRGCAGWDKQKMDSAPNPWYGRILGQGDGPGLLRLLVGVSGRRGGSAGR